MNIGGSEKYHDTAHSDVSTMNVEGAIAYIHAVNDIFSVTGSMGVDEHFQTSGPGK